VHTNLLGSMYIAHAALPHLLERKGSLMQVSSVAGRVARLGSGGYNATKWGINAFCESLRQEVTTQGVRVVVIEPGAVDTELTDHITDPEAKANSKKRFEGLRKLASDDIAEAVRYAVTQPEHVAINEILVRPTDQAN
jgi:NADP-dependent 3-hydroxy acid dehydrogenase YdfG